MAKVHALGHEMPMVPTVMIDDEIMVESGAIIDTILRRYSPDVLSPAPNSDAYPAHAM
jgi:glutathione S-transferase